MKWIISIQNNNYVVDADKREDAVIKLMEKISPNKDWVWNELLIDIVMDEF